MTRDALHEINHQFMRTAEVYARMRQNTDERGLDALVAMGRPTPSARALDVACGPGFLTLALAKRCAEATGLDATEAFLSLARAEAEARGLIQRDLVHVRPTERGFDFLSDLQQLFL